MINLTRALYMYLKYIVTLQNSSDRIFLYMYSILCTQLHLVLAPTLVFLGFLGFPGTDTCYGLQKWNKQQYTYECVILAYITNCRGNNQELQNDK